MSQKFSCVPRVPYHEYHSSEIPGNLEMTLRHLLSERHNDSASLSRYSLQSA